MIFGLINGINLIPVHSYFIHSSSSGGVVFQQKRPYVNVLNNDASSVQVNFGGFSIYKDVDISLGLTKFFSGSMASVPPFTNPAITDSKPMFTIRYRDVTNYRGNIQPKTLSISSNRNLKVFIVYGNSSTTISLTGSTFANTIGNLSYDTAATAYVSGGVLIYAIAIASGVTTLSLDPIIDWRLMGYNYNMSVSNQLLFSVASLSGNANITWIFNYSEF
jgi:hypothetical protein